MAGRLFRYAVALATILEATSSNVTLSERNLREFKVNAKLPAPAHLQNLKETADKIAGIQEKLRGEYLKNKGIHNVHHSDARQAEIAQCVFSALLASHQLASGAMSITAGVSTCGYGGVPAKIEACTANIGATLATLAGAAAFLTEVSIQCPHTLDHRDADCASSIETLISGLGGVAAHAAGAAQSCGNIPNGATIFNPVSVNDETGMANCILNTNQAAFFAARAGIQTDGLANGACGRDKSAADCSMSVTGALTSFASLGSFLAGAISKCTVYKIYSPACSANVLGLVADVNKVANFGSAMAAKVCHKLHEGIWSDVVGDDRRLSNASDLAPVHV